MDGPQIIQQLSMVYGRCRSYEDQGSVDIITDPGTQAERRERVAFRTAFVRPMFFRLEWKRFDPYTGQSKPEDAEAIWCDGKAAYSRNRFEDGVLECDSLDHAIASATGVAAHTVSSLLMPDILSFSFLRHGSLSVAADEVIFNDECCHICATDAEQRTDILVSKRDFCLRRIREERLLKGAHNVSLPPLPAGISDHERDEMLRVLSEAAEDLHTVSDCMYTHIRFDNPVPEELFMSEKVAW